MKGILEFIGGNHNVNKQRISISISIDLNALYFETTIKFKDHNLFILFVCFNTESQCRLSQFGCSGTIIFHMVDRNEQQDKLYAQVPFSDFFLSGQNTPKTHGEHTLLGTVPLMLGAFYSSLCTLVYRQSKRQPITGLEKCQGQ